MWPVRASFVEWMFFVLICIFHTHAAYLRCYKSSISNYKVTPLGDPLPLTKSTCIDLSLPTVFYTFGFKGRTDGPATTAVIKAYLATKKRNVILLDWEEEAKSGVFGIPISYALYAVPNAKKIGDVFGRALVQLAGAGLNMTQVHLLGHSLGAHLMAHAGRKARENGYVVPRVTGLDPAGALYEGTLAIQTGIDRTCARFVDIIHTDPGGYGTKNPSGSVDFWPNKGRTVQPGCPEGSYEMFSAEDLCSHDRSWRYYVESLKAPTSFLAVSAEDFDSWAARAYDANKTAYIGDLASTRARGNFYLTTNPRPPYGRGQGGTTPSNQPRDRRAPSLGRLLSFLR